MSYEVIEDNKKVVVMTVEEFQAHNDKLIGDTVEVTLEKIGYNVTSWASGRVYRTEIVEAIGRREFDRAVRKGRLHPKKNNPLKRNSKVYVRREEWERYRKWRNNRKF